MSEVQLGFVYRCSVQMSQRFVRSTTGFCVPMQRANESEICQKYNWVLCTDAACK
jgi:hypothetical protein